MDSTAEIIVRYSRTGGHKPPQDREILEIRKDGVFTLWRSIGSATYPPTPVGRFGGQLPTGDLNPLNSEITACIQAGDLKIPILPDAAPETVELSSVQANLYIHAEPEGSWGNLVARLRNYLKELTQFPLSAISIEVTPGGANARLSHLGPDPIQIDLADLTVRAVHWKGYKKLGDWFAPRDALQKLPAQLTASNDWSLALPFSHEFKVMEGEVVVAYVTLKMFDDKMPVPVSLESPRADMVIN